MMKVQNIEGSRERRILMDMITNPDVLEGIANRWSEHTRFRSTMSNVVSKLCLDYYEQYGKPPSKDVEGLVRAWIEAHDGQKDTIRLVEDFMIGLSSEYERLGEETNPSYVLDQADHIFLEMEQRRVAQGMLDHLDSGKLKKAEDIYQSYSPSEAGKGTGTHLFLDQEAFDESIRKEEFESIVPYHGDLGRFFQSAFRRGDLVAFIGPSGVGKSWWLIDVAWRAMCAHKRVVFFEVGDLTKAQVVQRFAVRMCGWPLQPCKSQIPREIKLVQDGMPTFQEEVTVGFEDRIFDDPLTSERIKQCRLKTLKQRVKSMESHFWLEVRPTSTCHVSDIRSVLRKLERKNGWTPDCILVDYIDILAMSTKYKDYREQVNEMWKQLHSIAQELKCCVVTATQANRESFGVRWMNPKHISEDRRKQDGLAALFAINVMDSEREIGITRLSWLKNRHAKFNPYHGVHCVGCLDIGNPAMVSYYSKGKRKESEEDEENPERNGKLRTKSTSR